MLEVGCGNGRTSCYLAKNYGRKVVGVDKTKGMVERTKERSKREGVEDKVEFKVGTAEELPFKDDTFDAVICESVIAFVRNKQRALEGFARVAKPKGFVGLNEGTFIKENLPAELAKHIEESIDKADFLTLKQGKELLEGAGLKDIQTMANKTAMMDEMKAGLKLVRLREYRGMMVRMIRWYLTRPAQRSFIKQLMATPKELMDYVGYGIYVGRK